MEKFAVCSEVPFEVTAYDKDGDVYVSMYTTPSEAMARRVASSLKRLVIKGSLRRKTSDGKYEPYDWITIFQGDNIVATV